jgi:8-oxo-dGTP diphosphatase/A/G-specific adenine glycosylase
MESLTHDYPRRRVLIRFYRCALTEGEPRAIGCQDIRWVGPEELALYQFPEADQRLMAKLRSDSEVWGVEQR